MKLWGLAIGVLGLLGSSCSKESSSATTGPAGVVVEMSGQVEATRAGGEPRPLALEAEVFADDTVETGPGSSVSIVLSHNNASLRLEADMSRRVDETLAWKAPRREGDSVLDRDVADQTAAAGRHTEREAAGTAATAVANRETAAAPPAQPDPPVKAVAPEPAPEPRAKPRPRPGTKRKAKRDRRPPPPPRDSKPAPRELDAVLAPRGAPALESAPAPGGGGGSTRGGPVDVSKLVRARIEVCHALAENAPAGSITAAVKIAGGKLSIVSLAGSVKGMEPVLACARKKIASLAITGAKPGTYRVSLELE